MNFQKVHVNPKPPTQSIWYNPTDKPVKLAFFISPGVEKQSHSRTDLYVIEPGDEAIIPSEFDSAIHRVDTQGNIIAGRAPQLVKVAELVNGKRVEVKERPQMIEALDPQAQARKEAEAKAALAANAKASADAALVVAEAERAKAMAAQAQKDAEEAKALLAKAEAERKAAEEAKAEAEKATKAAAKATKEAEKQK